MEEIIELKGTKYPNVIINNEIDDSKVMFPEKLKKANEMLEKHPIPANLRMRSFSKIEQEYGFEVCGVFKNANIEAKAFLLTQMNGAFEFDTKIRTTPETLNYLVKTHFGENINVRIRPQINEENQFEYELLAVIDAAV